MTHHSTRQAAEALLLIASIFVAACSSGSSGDGAGGSGPGGAAASGYCEERTAALVEGSGMPDTPATPLAETPLSTSSCNAVEREYAEETPLHLVECSPIEYTTNPPCTGAHYPFWAAYRVYEEPIPRGFWVHGLEHGAVAITYDCDDCDAEIEAAAGLLEEIGDDPLCATPSRRTLLAPDPRLETRWAASSWGFTLTADCFEPEIFRDFVLAHRGQGPEAVCSDGVNVAEPPP